jgi:hypothetical protein
MAAEQGYAEAQHDLGLAWRNGQGVPQDYARAHMWLSLAATLGDKEAAEDRDNLEKFMTPAQMVEAQELTAEWSDDPAACESFKVGPVPKWPQAIKMRGFSIMTPVGRSWCTDGPNWFRSSIVFLKNTHVERKSEVLSKKQRAHTFFAFAGLVDVDVEAPGNQDQLIELANKWINNKLPRQRKLSGKTLILIKNYDEKELMRFKLLNNKIMAYSHVGTYCVKYNAQIEETGNVRWPKEVLIMEGFGYLCRNPYSKSELIEVVLSERYLKGRRPGASLRAYPVNTDTHYI